jgi:sugar-specific transcriptional regulator TrmB
MLGQNWASSSDRDERRRMAMELSMEKIDDLVKVYDEKNESWKFVKRDKGFNKQLMMIEDTLSRFGLLRNEIRVYIYLARAGERKAAEVAEAISLHRTETYRILRDLEKKGIVFSVFEKPLKFTAVPMEKAVDLLIETQKMGIRLLEKEKVGLVELWSSMPQPKLESSKKEIFQILEGGQQIILKANELLKKAREEIQIFAPGEYLAQLYHSDFVDNLEACSKKLNIALLTEDSLKGRFFLEKMNWAGPKYRVVDVKNVPCFIISDRKELLIAIQQNEEEEDNIGKKKPRTVALWTNYNAFIETLEILFSKLNETAKTVQEICLRH